MVVVRMPRTHPHARLIGILEVLSNEAVAWPAREQSGAMARAMTLLPLDILRRVSDALWMTEMTTATAGERLGVSQRQVQRLIASGELPGTRSAGDAWLVDALTVNALARTRPSPGRPWSPHVAWAALWQLSGEAPEWLDRRAASRLSTRLAGMDAERLLHACRRRAIVRRYRVSESLLEDLGVVLVRSGSSATGAEAFGMGRDFMQVDGYIDDDALPNLVRRFHLTGDNRGNATLRVTSVRDISLESRYEMPQGVVAADLAESLEVRERSAGLRVLEGLLP